MRVGQPPWRCLAPWCLLAAWVVASGVAQAAGDGVAFEQRIRGDISALAGCGSRIAGYPGAAEAEAYIRSRLLEIGLTDLDQQEFDIVSPLDRGSQLTLDSGEVVTLHPVWPNLVATGTVIPGQVRGPVVYGGTGELRELNGLELQDAIVVMEFNSGTRWLNAAMLGASAVVFVEPDETTRQDAVEKFSRVPVAFPRFYVTRQEGQALLSRLHDGGAPVTAEIVARVDWVEAPARSIIATIPGSDPDLSGEAVVLQAYYDSMSVVPALAPGAEEACGIAAFLSVAEALVREPPGRSVILVATPGHFMGMAGMRELTDVLGPKGRRPREQSDFYIRGVKDIRKLIDRLDTGITEAEDRKERIARLALGTTPEDIQRYQLELTPRGPVDYDSEVARARRQVSLLEDKLRLTAIYRKEEHVPLTISLDLSSHSRQFGVAFAGHYFSDSTMIRFLSPLGKRLSSIAEDVAAEQGWDPESYWFDGTNPKQDKNWWDYFPGRVAFESEMILRAGRPGITIATGSDNRFLVDTPMDTPDLVDADAVAFQARAITEILHRFLSDPDLDRTAFKRTKRLKLPNRVYPIEGRVLEFVRRSSFLPQTPVPGAVVVIRGSSKSLMGVRTDVMTFSDASGLFTLCADQLGANIDAYYLDPETGQIRYAPDLGPEGERKFTRGVAARGKQDRPIILFPCRPVALYDLVDQRYLETLEQVYLYNARTNAEPLSFGCEIPVFAPPAGETGLAVEPCAVVFADPDDAIKISLGMGLLGARMLLLNSDPQHPEGNGFRPSDADSIPFTVYQAARDMHVLDQRRIEDFVSRGVTSPRVEGLHKEAGLRIDQIPACLEAKQYDKAVALARAAWAYESSAYPDVQKTKRDVVYGVVFYLALVLSFTYFVERLVVAAPTVQGRVAWTVAIFLTVFILLRMVHPAFDLAINPFIILLAFVILALALIVITIVVSKFNEQLEKLKQELGGIHKADVSRYSAAAMAFNLGVANMRRRGIRTGLTCVTLILVTFTVLSFTSVRSGVRVNKLPRQENPSYTGTMIRDKVWVQLEDTIPDVMDNEWAGRFVVSPRSWQVSADITKRANYDFHSLTDPSLKHTAHALLGLSPGEASVSALDQHLLPGGRWFSPEDTQSCVLPTSIAAKLGITAEAVALWNEWLPGLEPERASQARTADALVRADAAAFGPDGPVVVLSGAAYQVVGLIPDQVLDGTPEVEGGPATPGFLDLDGESILPVDFSQLKPEVLNQVREMMTQRFKLGRTGVASLIQDYKHFLGGDTAIIPYAECLRLGGTTRSVAMAIPTAEQTGELVDEYIQRLAVSLYATTPDPSGKGRVFLYSSIGSQSLDGIGTVLIPILIAALIVLNTMLGAVWERVKEIHVFSSVGLSPTHVGALFLAESCVYANIGAIVGYLLGQGVTKVLIMTGGLGALQTNYSSMSAVVAVVAVLITVLLSTLWPARKAAQMAVPDIERRWRLPEPDGDVLRIPMPFTVTGRDAPAANAFLCEFFEAYVGYAGGDFYAEDVSLVEAPFEHGVGYRLSLKTWLAPYDLGVSQTVAISTHPTGEHSIYELSLEVHREAGDISSWKKTNWLFLNIIRKQFLIWRTVPVEQKEKYAQRTFAMTGVDLAAEA